MLKEMLMRKMLERQMQGVPKEQVEKIGIYRVITPDEAVELSEKAGPLGGCVSLHPLIGGLDPKIGWENIELLVNKVMPRLKKKVA